MYYLCCSRFELLYEQFYLPLCMGHLEKGSMSFALKFLFQTRLDDQGRHRCVAPEDLNILVWIDREKFLAFLSVVTASDQTNPYARTILVSHRKYKGSTLKPCNHFIFKRQFLTGPTKASHETEQKTMTNAKPAKPANQETIFAPAAHWLFNHWSINNFVNLVVNVTFNGGVITIRC